MWAADGVMERVYATPFGELPGSVVILFPTVDAAAHSWDLAISLRRPFEFTPEATPAISAVVEATCTDVARDMGLIRPPTTPPDDRDSDRGVDGARRPDHPPFANGLTRLVGRACESRRPPA